LILRFSREEAREAEPPHATQMTDGAGEVRPPPRGFSLVVKPGIVRAWANNGLTLDGLVGRRLRIRGWIERRGGPTIEILDPLQIEVVDDALVATGVALPEPPAPAPRRRRTSRSQREASVVVAPP
jgi:hypothetical protein